MPNKAAIVQESMTVTGASSPPLPDVWMKLTDQIVARIGRVVHLPLQKMDASTALAGTGPTFMALVPGRSCGRGYSDGLAKDRFLGPGYAGDEGGIDHGVGWGASGTHQREDRCIIGGFACSRGICCRGKYGENDARDHRYC
ncbi:hypothetical protein BJX64DRAFT_136119 [Aspergillus heterothallicus]